MSFNFETSVLFTGVGKSSIFSVLMFIAGDPVDSGISSDGLVEWVNKDNLIELVGSILTNPIGVENSEILCSSSNSVFSKGSVGSCWLQLCDTLVDWLSVDNPLGHWSLSASTSDSYSVDDIALLSLISELSCLVRTRRSCASVDDWKLSVLPRSHSENESDDIRLLLSPELL